MTKTPQIARLSGFQGGDKTWYAAEADRAADVFGEGRPPKIDMDDIKCRLSGGERPADIARDMDVARSTVHVGKEPEDDALDDGHCILEAHIGTRYDGTISLIQFCRNFGVTVNGIIPEETDPEARRNTDLTGETTYWEGYLGQITSETSRRSLKEARSIFPEALLERPVWNEAYKLERLEATSPEPVDYANIWLIDGPTDLPEINIDLFILSVSLLATDSTSKWRRKRGSGHLQGGALPCPEEAGPL